MRFGGTVDPPPTPLPAAGSSTSTAVQVARLRADDNQPEQKSRQGRACCFSELNRVSRKSARCCVAYSSNLAKQQNHLPYVLHVHIVGKVQYGKPQAQHARRQEKLLFLGLTPSPNSFTLMRWNKHCSRAAQTATASGVSPPISGGAPPEPTAPMAPPACWDADCCRCRACRAANACAAFRRFLTSLARVAARWRRVIVMRNGQVSSQKKDGVFLVIIYGVISYERGGGVLVALCFEYFWLCGIAGIFLWVQWRGGRLGVGVEDPKACEKAAVCQTLNTCMLQSTLFAAVLQTRRVPGQRASGETDR